MLASGWRAVHYLADGDYEKSGHGEAECWLLPDAGFRRAVDGDALADAKAWRGSLSQQPGEESGGKAGGSGGDWGGSGDGAGGNFPGPSKHGRVFVFGILGGRSGGAGAVQDG